MLDSDCPYLESPSSERPPVTQNFSRHLGHLKPFTKQWKKQKNGTYLIWDTLSAIFIIPIHSTNSVNLSNSQHLLKWLSYKKDESENWPLEVNNDERKRWGELETQIKFAQIWKDHTGQRSCMISSKDFFLFWCITWIICIIHEYKRLRFEPSKILTKSWLIPKTQRLA